METETITFDTHDLLVSAEATWIRDHRGTLMQVWRALRKICHDIAPEEMYLDDASFSIFGSFVYRWTDTNYIEVVEGDDSSEDTEDVNEE